MQDETGEIAHLLERVRQRFLDTLVERDDALYELECIIEATGPTDAILNEISAIVHKFAGVAPSVGLHDLGQQARVVEDQIREGLSQGNALEAWHVTLPDYLNLKRIIDAALDMHV